MNHHLIAILRPWNKPIIKHNELKNEENVYILAKVNEQVKYTLLIYFSLQDGKMSFCGCV